MIEFLRENASTIWGIVALILSIAYGYKQFKAMPITEQNEKIKLWALWAVTSAEKLLKAKTGPWKLSMVYGMFLAVFPKIAIKMPLSEFRLLVDDALAVMKKIQEVSEEAKKFIDE
jgi:hypothetical protein